MRERRTYSAQGPRLREMVALARAFLPITPGELDRDKWLLNCQNGTVNLKTGELQLHNRADFITKIASVRYVRTSSPPPGRPTSNSFSMVTKA